MARFEIQETAAPNARMGELAINGKELPTPTYFPSLTRVSDAENVVEAVRVLDEQDEPLLPYTGGFVVESQLAPSVLDDFDRSVQTDLNGNRKFSNIYSIVDDLDRCLLIDPNTDRLLYFNYREDMREISDHLPDPFLDVADALDADDDEDGEDGAEMAMEHRDAYPRLKEEVSPPNFVENMLGLQNEYGPDLFLVPYYPIELDTYEEDIEANLDLYRISQNLANTLYDREVAPVLPVKRSILSADAEQENGRRQPPQAWLDIIHTYRELDTDILFLKATNVETDPDELHKTDSEGIFHFFRLFRQFTDMPTFFLGLDEFSYILMAQGLDGYSHPMYQNPFRRPIRGGDSSDIPRHRKFLVPRKWGWERFDQLDSLGCNGPFCEPYNDTHPSDIELSDQDTLRKRHWLWLRDEELREINDAITKDEVRPGLQSICKDSEWKKNFTMFL